MSRKMMIVEHRKVLRWYHKLGREWLPDLGSLGGVVVKPFRPLREPLFYERVPCRRKSV